MTDKPVVPRRPQAPSTHGRIAPPEPKAAALFPKTAPETAQAALALAIARYSKSSLSH